MSGWGCERERERRSDLVRRAHWGELGVSEWSEWAAADERGKFEKSSNNMFAPGTRTRVRVPGSRVCGDTQCCECTQKSSSAALYFLILSELGVAGLRPAQQ